MTRHKNLKLKDKRLTLDIRNKLFTSEGGETEEQISQRNHGCSLPGSVQGQVRWSFGQLDVEGSTPA